MQKRGGGEGLTKREFGGCDAEDQNVSKSGLDFVVKYCTLSSSLKHRKCTGHLQVAIPPSHAERPTLWARATMNIKVRSPHVPLFRINAKHNDYPSQSLEITVVFPYWNKIDECLESEHPRLRPRTCFLWLSLKCGLSSRTFHTDFHSIKLDNARCKQLFLRYFLLIYQKGSGKQFHWIWQEKYIKRWRRK